MWVFIEAVDVWFFRDARPFTAGEEHRGVSRPLPSPWTLAGALKGYALHRALGGRWEAYLEGRAEPPLYKALGGVRDYGEMRLRGPLLARRGPAGSVEALFPIPADTLWPPAGSGSPVARLAYQEPDAGVWGEGVHRRRPKGPEVVPAWARTALPLVALEGQGMTEEGVRRWMFREEAVGPQGLLEDLDGWLQAEERVGVKLAPGARTVEEGFLYSASLIRPRADQAGTVGLLAEWEVPGKAVSLPSWGLFALGGEARGARWTRLEKEPPLQQVLGDEAREPLAQRIAETRGFRVLLLTPAMFSGGWVPDFVGADGRGGVPGPGGARVRLHGALVGKPVAVTGWDLARGSPKPLRQGVPPGSVYFFSLEAGEGDATRAARWVVETLHWRCSLQEWTQQDGLRELHKAGFGLTLVGVWKPGEGQDV